ncbi:Pectate lyase [Roseateles sp. YR242]|uniref:pectate lyase n=1 Tax=Roseateles sp. YR242 TaxID=1855305 RepID=UPI0008CD03CF|nr:pectate lyase [Roseateles sp. YR242]SEL08729.1 Pectate lyase [Roseateles sp. YR242]
MNRLIERSLERMSFSALAQVLHAMVALAALWMLLAPAPAHAAPGVRSVPSCTKVNVSATIEVAAGATWDGTAVYGKWVCLVGTASNMKGTQSESQIPMFKLNNGATVKNVVIGDGSLGTGTNLAAGGADGVHCYGVCNITNVYWADVGEDAATAIKLSGVTSKLTISGGAAFKAADKVFQHNGDGTLVISDFYADNVGKLYRSCGNCSTQYARKSTITGVRLGTVNAAVIGVNSSYDSKSGIAGQYDVTTITDLVYSGSKTKCDTYVGTGKGSEPGKDTSASNIARSCIFK